MARNYLRRYSANHTARDKRDLDRIIFTQPVPKSIRIGCILWQDGGCSKAGGEWTVATELGAPVVLCAYHADRICSALLARGIRYDREAIPRD